MPRQFDSSKDNEQKPVFRSTEDIQQNPFEEKDSNQSGKMDKKPDSLNQRTNRITKRDAKESVPDEEIEDGGVLCR